MKRLLLVVLAAAAPLLSQDPRLVVDLSPSSASVGLYPFLGRASAPGSRLLALDDGVRGTELWRTDGTASGTVFVREFVPGPSSPLFSFGTTFGGSTVFVVEINAIGELWRSDGTAAGTQLMLRAPQLGGTYLGLPQSHPGLGGDMFLQVDNVMWRTDGTVAGSTPLGFPLASLAAVHAGRVYLHEIASGTTYVVTGTQILAVHPNTSVMELPDGEPLLVRPVVSPGGVSSTHLIAIARPGTPTAVVSGLFSQPFGAGGALAPQWRLGELYWADDQSRVYAWDRVAPPRLLHPSGGLIGPEVAGRVLFAAFGAASGIEPWITDGTPAGTSVLDLVPGPGSTSFRFGFGIPSSGRAVLWIDLGANGFEPWSTDGTVAGTVPLGDLEPGPAGSLPEFLFGSLGSVGERRAVVPVRATARGCELWLTDGTPAGSRWLTEIRPGPLDGISSTFVIMAAAGHRYVFAADDGLHDNELWSVDLEGSTSRLEAQGSRTFATRGDAVLGASIGFASEGLQASDLGAVAVGLPATQATQVGANGTWLFVDLAQSLPFLLIAPSAQGAWSQTVVVPNDAALQGLTLVAQAGFAGPTIPGGVEFGSAFWLCLGR